MAGELIGALCVTLSADTAEFAAGMGQAERQAQALVRAHRPTRQAPASFN